MDNWLLVVNNLRHAIAALKAKQKKTLLDRWILFWQKKSLKNLEKVLAAQIEEGKR